MEKPYFFTDCESPVGKIRLIKDADGFLNETFFIDRSDYKKYSNNLINIKRDDSLFKREIKQLVNYFSGKLKSFNIEISFRTGTEFQKKVWQELMKIPYGKTISYEELAKNIGHNNAVRAVGSANGKNPINIIVPCHRVIRKNGELGGYSSGIDIKRFLIELENKYSN